MDPDATIQSLTSAIDDAVRNNPFGPPESPRIDELLRALDRWISRNGFLPVCYGPILGFRERNLGIPGIKPHKHPVYVLWSSDCRLCLRGLPPGKTDRWEFCRYNGMGQCCERIALPNRKED